MPNPGKTNPNYAHRPADAQRFDLSPNGRTWTKPRKRGPATSIAPVEFRPYDADPTPQPLLPATSTLVQKLKAKRRDEKKVSA